MVSRCLSSGSSLSSGSGSRFREYWILCMPFRSSVLTSADAVVCNRRWSFRFRVSPSTRCSCRYFPSRLLTTESYTDFNSALALKTFTLLRSCSQYSTSIGSLDSNLPDICLSRAINSVRFFGLSKRSMSAETELPLRPCVNVGAALA